MKGIPLLALSIFSTAFLSFTPLNKKYIVIDAGHGGNDHGTVFGQFSEKDITLSIAKEIQKLSGKQDPYEVILIRNEDTYPSLSERTLQINKLNPEMVISLHVNTSPQEETVKQEQKYMSRILKIQRNWQEKSIKNLVFVKLKSAIIFIF